jgi:hypothetical protein
MSLLFRFRRPRLVMALAAATVGLAAAPALGDAPLMGTSGSDVIRGTSGNDTIFALDGNDVIFGNAGDDDIDGGPGADDIHGGAGSDSVLYGDRTAPVSVSLDDAANDGQAGEGDNVRSDVENIYGGQGNDTLTGNSAPNLLDGSGGDDVIFDGGGRDRVFGGDGNDTITSFDGVEDIVDCGPGHDTVTADRFDLASNCERKLPPPRVRARIDYAFDWKGALTTVSQLVVSGIPRSGAVELHCHRGGCPFATNRIKLRSGQTHVDVTSFFRGRHLRAGASLEVWVTAPGKIGKVLRFVMQTGAKPRVVAFCLPPGSTVPTRACA